MRFLVIGMSHKSAPLELRERFAVPGEQQLSMLGELVANPAIDEAMVLSTCNRVEAYVVPSATDAGGARIEVLRQMASERGVSLQSMEEHGYVVTGREAVHHLMRVASSLDSMVVGEPQILGQVKEAASTARGAGTVGAVLGRLLDRAFAAAKAVRSRTGIAREVVSIGSVSVDLARHIFPSMEDCRVLIVGAGKMAEATARSLSAAGATKVYVANRSHQRAQELADRHGWRARSLTELEDLLVQSDVVITSTGSPRPIVTVPMARRVLKQRKYRPLVLVDIAVPRDVESAVGELDTIYLYNVDDLEEISRTNMAGRQREAEAAEQLVVGELAEVDQWFRSLALKPTLVAIRKRADSLAQDELERTLSKRLAHLSEADREALQKMCRSMVAKMLHPTMAALRDSAATDGSSLVVMARLLHGVEDSAVDGPNGAGDPSKETP